MKDLRVLSLEDIKNLVATHNEKPFRAGQIHEWIWTKNVGDIEEMSNLSKEFRNRLKEEYTINKVQIDHQQFSNDGTIKSRFKLHDGHFIEGVLIPTEKRMTACVSSQVGCSLTCKFCATGYIDRKRNVHFDEIYDQVFLIHQQALKHFGKPLTNIVFMGMGEPLLNFSHVFKSIEFINADYGMGMSPKRITVSTAGISKMIIKMADENPHVNLALSLHAASDTKRNDIMPINESNNLNVLIEALDYYYQKTKKPVTFEYILFSNFNDALSDADDLIKICRRIPSKVNIIEYNPISNAQFIKPDEQRTDDFMDYLGKNNINARLRRSRGKDIDAACGQLANINH
jgi:23S rRNA (adenine2503-C2)-methyltransferase